MTQASRFRTAAVEIADGIVAAARSDDDSVHWLTVSIDPARQVAWRPSAGLYGGTSGIALFLLDASTALDRPDYRELAIAALTWCARAAERNPDYSFYIGRTGVSFAMMRAAAITGDTAHLERALRLAQGYEAYAASAAVNDLLVGVAGSIIGFLHLHQQTHEKWTIGAVRKLAQRLVSSARWTPIGVCWDFRPEHIKGLCGLAHGAAGVAFALLEAAEYLGEPAYRELALAAFRYEASCYNAGQGAWPDFRKLDSDRGQGYGQEQLGLSDDALTQPAFMDGWCHGAPGIALSRLRALELLGPQWSGETMQAIARTRTVTERLAQSTFTLCHGAGGNGEVFLEAARVLGDPRYVSWAEQIGELAIASRERNGLFLSGYRVAEPTEDLSLMMGNAGIGHFFLSLAGGATNVLAPRLTASVADEHDQVTIGSVVLTLAEHLMPRSMDAIEEKHLDECASFFTEWRERGEVLEFIRLQASRVGEDAEAAFESEKLRMLDQCPSFALVAITREWEHRRAEALTEDELGSCHLQVAQFSLLYRSGDDSRAPRLLRIVGAEVEETELTEFSAAIIEAFTTPTTMAAAIRALEEVLQTRTSATIEALRAAVHGQVLAALRAGILVVAGSREPATNWERR